MEISLLMDTSVSKKQFEETEIQAGVVDITAFQITTKIVTKEQADNLISQTAEKLRN
jgi:hypothetical protein